jgi:phosphopantothenoylcysteine decarboxylase/phosphopantothenate--cysteine ligase
VRLTERRDPLDGRRIVLGVSASIAAYKAVYLASRLVQSGAVVDVVMTPEATELVRPLSFQAITHRPVAVEMFGLLAETGIGHVTLGQAADLVVVAPATANTIARLALGLADDMLVTTVLASRAPLIVAPAMESTMYQQAAVQEHLATLRSRGAVVVGPDTGRLASGLEGPGRMAEPEELVETAKLVLARRGDLAGRRLVVTAGPTREPIDPVRFLSNRSSGKMGFAVAEAARDRGAEVVLVAGPTCLVRTAAEMLDAVLREEPSADALIMSAAVADFRPAVAAEQKIKKTGEALTLSLEPTVDILGALAERPQRGVRVGFAAETERLVERARQKLQQKRLDLIVANDVTVPGSGFGSEQNQAVLIARDGREEPLPLMPKVQLAHRILDEVRRLWGASESEG